MSWGGDLGCDEPEREQSIGDTLAEMQASTTDVFEPKNARAFVVKRALVSLGFEKTAVMEVDGDWAAAEQFNLALEQLANGRREHVQKSQYARSKIAWKVATYAEAIRYRTVALADGAAQNWNGGNILCAALCARATVETVAQLFYVKNGVAVALKVEELNKIDRIVEQGTFATRVADLLKESPELKAQRISTWLDKLDRELPGVRRHYNYLSDMVHPNYLGTFQFFASVDSATGTVSFSDSKRRDKNTLEAITTPLMLIVLAKECFEQFDGFIKQVSDLQHSREPTDGRSEDDSSGTDPPPDVC